MTHVTSEAVETLPPAFDALVADYVQHLRSERHLSEHSIRAYSGDILNLLDHLTRLGIHDIAELDLLSLRSWLAKQQTLGLARTTIARLASTSTSAPSNNFCSRGNAIASSSPPRVVISKRRRAISATTACRAGRLP